jgi:hypothetical protein
MKGTNGFRGIKTEWNEFVEILKTLPYVKDIVGYEE